MGYKEERESLLNKAQSLLNDNNVSEANKIMNQVRELDKEEVNKRALEDNHRITDITAKGVIVKDGRVLDSINSFGGEKLMDNIFLNKADNLSDKIMLNEENNILKNEGALANVVKGMVTGKWDNSALKNAVTTTATGVLIPEYLSAKVIDLARKKSLFGAVGVPTVPMESDSLTISRIKTDPVFKFKKEGEAAVESSFELDSVKLESKTAYGYAYVTLEAINSSNNLEAILYDVFSQAMAQCIDESFLYGQESDSEGIAPKGIMNDVNVNTIVATESGGYDDIIKAIGKVKASNGKPTALGINSQTEELLSLLKTTDGQYLTAPKAVQELNQVVSNQLKYNQSAGSDALVFDPNALLIGIQNNIQIKIIEDSECLKKGLVGFQIYSMLDCKATTPKNICKITGIK